MELRNVYGGSNVYATDINQAPQDILDSGPFHLLDVRDEKGVAEYLVKYKINQVYQLAAILSGNAEKLPAQAWDFNMRSLMFMLELARDIKLDKIFWPSSIAVFGPSSPKENTPQVCISEPNTVYGISKLAGERWTEYYYNRYGIDTRSIRYPGLISYKTEAGGGTTDYAVEIYYEAIRQKKYECFLKEDTALPMMFMADAIKATIDLMEAESSSLSIRSSYNVAGFSIKPSEFAAEIRKHIPEFKITYNPDFRQKIADSWPASIDDTVARYEWGLNYEYDLAKMTDVMLREVGKKLAE
jgi:nucleoside-diphosphate-sugar epimerase